MCYIVQVDVVLVSNIYIGIKLYRTIVVIQPISRDIDRYRIKLYLLITVRLYSWLIVKLDGNTADVQLIIRSIVLWLISTLVLLLGSRFTLLSLLLQPVQDQDQVPSISYFHLHIKYFNLLQ